jgi:acetyl/propionyl-CoA carboxylase alpha subunit
MSNIIAAAENKCRCHPGYGFLSENSNFQKYVKNMGKFMLPEMIDRMGDKACKSPIEAGCPVFQVSCILESFEQAEQTLKNLVIQLKATAGGGEKECVLFGKKKIYKSMDGARQELPL